MKNIKMASQGLFSCTEIMCGKASQTKSSVKHEPVDHQSSADISHVTYAQNAVESFNKMKMKILKQNKLHIMQQRLLKHLRFQFAHDLSLNARHFQENAQLALRFFRFK